MIVKTYAQGEDAPAGARRRWQLAGLGALHWYAVATTDLTVGQEVDEERLSPTERACVYLLAATWHLMQMPTLAESRTQQAGSDKKGRTPRGRTPVRSSTSAGSPSATPRPTNQGRTTPIASSSEDTGDDNPTGQGEAVVRLQFIEPHIKGLKRRC